MSKILTITIIAIIISSSSAIVNAQNGAKLTINVGGFNNNNGKSMVSLFKEESNIPKEPFIQANAQIQNGKSQIILDGIPYGEYAIIVWHDENNNSILDHKWGFPAEPMGFSNNWELTLISGMPTFEKLKFEFNKKRTICEVQIQQ